MPIIDFNEDECTLLLLALQELHVDFQRQQSVEVTSDVTEQMEAINRLEEKVKEAE